MAETKTSAESHLWKLIAIVSAISGVFFLVLAWKTRGPVEIGNLALGEGLAGSFLLLTTVASVLHARVFDSLSGKPATHTLTLRIIGGILTLAGFALVATAGSRSMRYAIPTLNQVTTGLAGAFLIFTGFLSVHASRLLEAIKDRAPEK